MWTTLLISLVAGTAIGILVGADQYVRIKNGKNQRVIRYLDGSIFGGFYKVVLGIVVLWTIVGFVVTYAITSVVKWIL